jgi:pimeloyl-ACP methyl ester carboxylesterase
MSTTSVQTVRSADGTKIAFETFGEGEPLIAVCGATCDRALMRLTAAALGEHFMAVNYDRRGRGDSGDTPPYAVEREIEDIGALIDAVGAPASLYGHSSGAGLVLHAAAAGLPVRGFVVHDPPYSPDDEAAQDEARRLAREIADLLDSGAHSQAIETFFRATGMPQEVIDEVRESPRWNALETLAPTLAYDSGVMGDEETGAAIPERLAARAAQPALVLVGGESPPFMLDVSRRLAELLPQGTHHVLAGQGHVAEPAVVARAVADFLRDSPQGVGRQ